jgi:thiol-disulfide isomerase/thioredoxin
MYFADTCMMTLLTEIRNTAHFQEILQANPGQVIIKFGAEWCGPCKKIESQVHEWMHRMPQNVLCIMLDVDECFELYAFLKTKKMVNGIPAILSYDRGNVNYIPSDSVIGADVEQVNLFFERCMAKSM